MRSLSAGAAFLFLSACAFVEPDRIHYIWTPEPAAASPTAAPAAAAHQLVHEAINARLDALVDQGFSLRRVEPHANVDAAAP